MPADQLPWSFYLHSLHPSQASSSTPTLMLICTTFSPGLETGSMEAAVCQRNQQMNSLSCDWQCCQWCTTGGNTHKSYLTVRWSRPACVWVLNCVRCTVACSQVPWPGFETLTQCKHYSDTRANSLCRAKLQRAQGEGERKYEAC